MDIDQIIIDASEKKLFKIHQLTEKKDHVTNSQKLLPNYNEILNNATESMKRLNSQVISPNNTYYFA